MKDIRSRIVEQALWGAHNTGSIHYAQIRPMPLRRYKAHRLPITTDCSGFATCCYYAAGAPDPNGFNYNGQGNTVTLVDHLPVVRKHELLPGDLIVFDGMISHQHVVVVVKPGADPSVVSHGQEAGPFVIRLSAEIDAHPGQPVIYLRGVKPEPRQWEVLRDGRVVAHTRHPRLYMATHMLPKHTKKNFMFRVKD